MEKIKVFLSDPQVLFREGIHFIVSGEDDFEVTGETTSNEEALSHVTANPPGVVILSMNDAKVSGADTTRRIKRDLSSVYVIMTLDNKDDETVFSAIKSGASACITKDTDPECLLDIIRVVAQGNYPITEEILTPGLASMILNEFTDMTTLNEELNNLLANITAKETALLKSVVAGSTLEQITEKLEMTEETVRRHLRLITNKLVGNEQSRALIEATQRSIPGIIRGTGPDHTGGVEYVTKTEFNEFKDNLMERLKSFIGELA